MSHSRHLKYFPPGDSCTFILHAEHSEIHFTLFTVVNHQTRNSFNSFKVRHLFWFHYVLFEWNIIDWVNNFWALVYSWSMIKKFVFNCLMKNMTLLFNSIKVIWNGIQQTWKKQNYMTTLNIWIHFISILRKPKEH